MKNTEMMTVREASAVTGLSTSSLYRYNKNGRIKILPPVPPRISKADVYKLKVEMEMRGAIR